MHGPRNSRISAERAWHICIRGRLYYMEGSHCLQPSSEEKDESRMSNYFFDSIPGKMSVARQKLKMQLSLWQVGNRNTIDKCPLAASITTRDNVACWIVGVIFVFPNAVTSQQLANTSVLNTTLFPPQPLSLTHRINADCRKLPLLITIIKRIPIPPPPNTLPTIEHMTRIIPLLNLHQRSIIPPKESALPPLLTPMRFIEIRSSTRRQFLQRL